MRISRAETFRGFHGSLICYGLPGCSAPCPDLTGFPAIGAFYFQASNRLVTLPVAGYNYSIDWTPTLAGLSPAGMAARLAARHTPSAAYLRNVHLAEHQRKLASKRMAAGE